jgi:hypothetical protein
MTINKHWNLKESLEEPFNFFDLPGTTDIHLRKAFRHAIGLPEELMQDAWKDTEKQHEQHKWKHR